MSDEASASRVVDLLDALENMVVGGRRVVFTPTVMVNEEEALDLIDRARSSLPDSVKGAHAVLERAREVVEQAETAGRKVYDTARAEADRAVAEGRAEAERVVGEAHGEAERVSREAHDEAERTLAEARRQAAAMVDAHAVTAAAQQRAAALEADAAATAQRYRADADGYAREVLTKLEAQLTRSHEGLRKAIDALPG